MTKYILALFLMTGAAFADNNHGATFITEVTENTFVTNTTTEQAAGVALAIAASQHNFYLETNDWQASIGLGSYDNQGAASFGIAKRLKGVLVNGSVGRSNGATGYGLGASLRF